jgi:GNAT superfamily N-acetyltransferase
VEIIIRPYRAADEAAVATVWGEGWKSTGVSTGSIVHEELRTELGRQVADGWQLHVATTPDGEVVGYVAISGDTLERLFVSPSVQSQGVGKRLLDFVKTQLPQGFWLTTAVDSRAPRFYAREGLVRGAAAPDPRWGHLQVRFDWRPHGRQAID